MYLCQFFSLSSYFPFHTQNSRKFSDREKLEWRPMRVGGTASGAEIAVLFLSRNETRPENLNINYFFKFLISIDFMMQIMFSDFRFCRAGAFLLVLRQPQFNIVLLSKPPPRRPRPPAISHSIPDVPSSSSIFDNFRFRWTEKEWKSKRATQKNASKKKESKVILCVEGAEKADERGKKKRKSFSSIKRWKKEKLTKDFRSEIR